MCVNWTIVVVTAVLTWESPTVFWKKWHSNGESACPAVNIINMWVLQVPELVVGLTIQYSVTEG